MGSNAFEGRAYEPREAAQYVQSPEDILSQLEVSEERYQKAVADFEKGDALDREYLEQMHKNLVDFKNLFIRTFGTMTPENKGISDRIAERLLTLRRILKTAQT